MDCRVVEEFNTFFEWVCSEDHPIIGFQCRSSIENVCHKFPCIDTVSCVQNDCSYWNSKNHRKLQIGVERRTTVLVWRKAHGVLKRISFINRKLIRTYLDFRFWKAADLIRPKKKEDFGSTCSLLPIQSDRKRASKDLCPKIMAIFASSAAKLESSGDFFLTISLKRFMTMNVVWGHHQWLLLWQFQPNRFPF